MKTINYELALRALNEAVAKRGYNHVDRNAAKGLQCSNVSLVEGVWVPECIVGTALVWLGVPAEWFHEQDCIGVSYVSACGRLQEEGVMQFDDEATRLLGHAQVKQDRKHTWGEAVTMAHLGDDLFHHLRLDEAR